MAFIDFIPENNTTEIEKGVFITAHTIGKHKTIQFKMFIGNKVLAQLEDAQGVPWSSELVTHVMVQVGTGEHQGQMIISAAKSGNIVLKMRDAENPRGRWFSVKKFPGINEVIKRQEAKWQVEPHQRLGKILHITEYQTGDVNIADIRQSDTGAMPQTKPEPTPTPAKPAILDDRFDSAGYPKATPPAPVEHRRLSKDEVYAAISKVGKKDK